MLLSKLESGFLLLQTPQGPVAVEPSSFWERVYLLWTFRNFRELSPLLLNARQTALINKLFFEHAAVVPQGYEPGLQIGVVEDFVPSAIESYPTPAAKTDAAPTMKTKLPEQAAGQDVAPRVIPIAAWPAMSFDGHPAAEEGIAGGESAASDGAEIAPRRLPRRSFGSIESSPIVSRLRHAWSNLRTYKLVVPRRAVLKFAGAIGVLSLCVCFIVAGYRVGAISGSHARNSPPQRSRPDSPSAPMPTPVAAIPTSTPEGPAEAIADPETEVKPAPEGPAEAVEDPEAEVKPAHRAPGDAVDDPGAEVKPVPEAPVEAVAESKAAAKPSPAKRAFPVSTPRPTMAPESAAPRATARVARSSGGSYSAVLSRVPTPAPSRRTTLALAPGSSGAMERAAQNYFDLAKQQMRQGNYSAATANYRRAWQIEETIAAAKGREARARRAMQARNQIIAKRRYACAQSWTTQGCVASSIPNR
jgi:hypothetical protein